MGSPNDLAFPVAERWFERCRIDDSVTLLIEPYVDPMVRCNIWHVRGRERDLIIDMGMGVVSLRAELEDVLERPVLAVTTHGHFDHVGSWHEFDERLAHGDEPVGRAGSLIGDRPLVTADYPRDFVEMLAAGGYPLDEYLVTAIPHAGFDVHDFAIEYTTPTTLVADGDVLDLGDRSFEVLHVPGHSPGSIGLWEAATRTFFSGDAVYDGPLLDEVVGADIDAYIATMRRLRSLPVEVVHGGHEESFGRDRFVAIIDGYLAARDG
ncbi:MAG: MBL fold metallo-hydrolase [Acidimicrobiia bacterium]